MMKELKPTFMAVIILTMVTTIGGPLVLLFMLYSNQSQVDMKKQAMLAGDPATVISEVGSVVELPAGETPAIHLLTSVETLQRVPFFQSAKVGDIVLVYEVSGKAYLYDPVTHKIRDTGLLAQATPPDVAETSGNVAGAVASTPSTIGIALVAGTEIEEMVEKIEPIVLGIDPNIEIIEHFSAKEKSYAQTAIVDVSGTHKDIAQSLALQISGRVVEMPDPAVALGISLTNEIQLLVIVGDNAEGLVVPESTAPAPTPSIIP